MFFRLIKTWKEMKQRNEYLRAQVDTLRIRLETYLRLSSMEKTNAEISKVCVSRHLDKLEQKEIEENNPYVRDYILNSMAREIADYLLNNDLVTWETETDSYGGCTIYAEVKVATSENLLSGGNTDTAHIKKKIVFE